eukprot:s1018_g11.t1
MRVVDATLEVAGEAPPESIALCCMAPKKRDGKSSGKDSGGSSSKRFRLNAQTSQRAIDLDAEDAQPEAEPEVNSVPKAKASSAKSKSSTKQLPKELPKVHLKPDGGDPSCCSRRFFAHRMLSFTGKHKPAKPEQTCRSSNQQVSNNK